MVDLLHSLKILQTKATTYLNLSEENASTKSYLTSSSLDKIGLF